METTTTTTRSTSTTEVVANLPLIPTEMWVSGIIPYIKSSRDARKVQEVSQELTEFSFVLEDFVTKSARETRKERKVLKDFVTKLRKLSIEVNDLKTASKRPQEPSCTKCAMRKCIKCRSIKKPRKPSGFAKPAPISDELARFLGEEPGTELSRIDVTRRITMYIRDHNLQKPEDRRVILCDETLLSLLNVGPEFKVTFFNLQTLMKCHYPKKK